MIHIGALKALAPRGSERKKQISKMGRKNKVTKKVVGSANGRAVRGEEADGSTEEFAVAGMGLQELHSGRCRRLWRRKYGAR